MSSIIVVIVMGMTMSIQGVTALSQFQSDAAFSIVDNNLSFPIVNETAPEFDEYGPIYGFDDPVPVLKRDGDAMDPETGVFTVPDDGSYVFLAHRADIGPVPAIIPICLTVVPASASDNSTNITLGKLEALGLNTISALHVVTELERGDRVFFSNPNTSPVEGDVDNPFIFNSFLVAHKPISPVPPVRQSIFAAVAVDNDLSSLESRFIYGDSEPDFYDFGGDFDTENNNFFVAPFRGLYAFHLSVTFSLNTTSSMGPAMAAHALVVNGFLRSRVQAIVDITSVSRNAAIAIVQLLYQKDQVEVVNLIETPDVYSRVEFSGYLLA